MFGKVKKWLGIEGVKVELVLPETLAKNSKTIKGKLRFFSKNPQTITQIKLVMIEKYSRGRRSEQKIDEYEIGEITLEQKIHVPAEDPIELDFELPFTISKSEIDELQDTNIIFGAFARTAKWLRGVKSEFRIEVYAKVSGVALDPFDRRIIVFT